MHTIPLPPPQPSPQPPANRGIATRSRGKLLALFAATLVGVYLCWRIVEPFLPAIVLAATLAMITQRPMNWLRQRVQRPGLQAGIGAAVVALAVVLPVGLLGFFAVREIVVTVEGWNATDLQTSWEEYLEQHPRLDRAWNEASPVFDLQQMVGRGVEWLQSMLAKFVQATAALAVQGALTIFVLFYFFRDEERVLSAVRRLMPLDEAETDDLFTRVNDAVHATVFGTVTVAMIQGLMGGIILAFLGVPGAALWAIVMGTLSIIPYLGSFVVWGPTAAIFALSGEWSKAAILVTYGACAIGLIDNLIYPMLVGQRLQQHTVVAFVAILGGVFVFGGMGVIMGPIVVAATIFLVEIWRRRTAHGESAERA
jgi:predicted PurR-regulated permease PerM